MRVTSVIEVNLSAVERNARRLQSMCAPGAAVCGVIKADAYGLGAVRIARALHRGGVERLAVYTPEQAAEVLALNLGVPVLVLMPATDLRRDECYRALLGGTLHLTAHGPEHLDALIAMSRRYGVELPVHIEVDTGIHRGGCAPTQLPAMLATIADARHVSLRGVFTHFAASESDLEFTHAQLRAFNDVVRDVREAHPDVVCHAANTCAMLRDPATHLDMVRIGQGWAGYGPEWLADVDTIDGTDDLEPCVRWSSEIVQLKTIADGATVGYGRQWTADGERVIALVPVGYADGYSAALAGRDDRAERAHVMVQCDTTQRPAPVVGAISMDQITIDVTDIVRAAHPVGVGTVVELITPDRRAPNHVVKLARLANTSPYELLCRLHSDVRRVYVHGKASGVIETRRDGVIAAEQMLHGVVRAESGRTAAALARGDVDSMQDAVG